MDNRLKCVVLGLDAICLATILMYSVTSRFVGILPMIKCNEQKWDEMEVEESFYTKSLPEAISPPRIIKENILQRKKCGGFPKNRLSLLRQWVVLSVHMRECRFSVTKQNIQNSTCLYRFVWRHMPARFCIFLKNEHLQMSALQGKAFSERTFA